MLVAKGLSNREIAQKLFISLATVARHIANIMQKLDLHSRVQLAMRFAEIPARPGHGSSASVGGSFGIQTDSELVGAHGHAYGHDDYDSTHEDYGGYDAAQVDYCHDEA